MASKKEIDAHLAAALRRLRAVAAQTRAEQLRPRTVAPGPNLLKRMTVGMVVYEIAHQWVEQDTKGVDRAATELERRGFDQAAAEARNPSPEASDEIVAEVDFFNGQEPNPEVGLRRCVTALDHMAGDVDKIDFQPLSNAETIADLEAVTAPPEMVDAYVLGLGDSDKNPAEVVKQQLDSGEKLPLSFTNALDAAIGEREPANDLTL